MDITNYPQDNRWKVMNYQYINLYHSLMVSNNRRRARLIYYFLVFLFLFLGCFFFNYSIQKRLNSVIQHGKSCFLFCNLKVLIDSRTAWINV